MSGINEPQRGSKVVGGQQLGVTGTVAQQATADGKESAANGHPAVNDIVMALSGKPGKSQLALPGTTVTTSDAKAPVANPAEAPVGEKVPGYNETFGNASYVKDGANKDMLALAQKVVDKNPALKGSPLAQHVKDGKMGPEDVKALQSELQAKGYDVGHTGTDGKYGPNTHAALQKMLAGEKPAPKAQDEQPANKDKKNPVASPADEPTRTTADNRTAIYDVSSGTVTLPDGTKLEAHSGRGDAQDDPNSQKQRNRGTTPTGTYKLTPREARFHGVAALRLTPINGTNTHGRDGFLAHSYMLGPKGESHGCVVFKNYPAFLKAYQSGQINQIKIVP